MKGLMKWGLMTRLLETEVIWMGKVWSFKIDGYLGGIFISYGCLTNYHKPGGFKQYTFLLSHLWRPEVQNQCHWGQNQGVSWPRLPPEPREEIRFLAFSIFWCCWHSLVYGSITPISASVAILPSLLSVSYLSLLLVRIFRVHWDNPG